MRNSPFQLLLLIGTGLVFGWLPADVHGQKVERLGKVQVGKHEATVDFQDCSLDQGLFRVIITWRKPRHEPPIVASRIQVWQLEIDNPAHLPEQAVHPRGKFLPEDGDGAEVTVRAHFGFQANTTRELIAALVILVDDKPTAFQLPQGPIASKVVAAWRRSGFFFHAEGHPLWKGERPQPAFYGPRSPLPPGVKLPTPAVPFDLIYELDRAGALARLPGRSRAQRLVLNFKSLAREDARELASLTQLRALELNGTVGAPELRALTGLKRLQRLRVASQGMGDAEFTILAAFQHLRGLEVNSATTVTQQGWKMLGELHELHTLRLNYTSIGGAGLKVLGKLTQLRELDLGYNKITAADLKDLADLKQLHTLHLNSLDLDDAIFKELSQLPQLRVLHLGYTKVTGVGLKELAHLPLEELNLIQTEVNDIGGKELAHLKRLRDLNLARSKIGAGGLAGVQSLRELRKLDLGKTKVASAGLKELAELKGLRWLNLESTGVGAAGLKYLAGLQHLRVLNLSSTPLTDVGLRELASLKQLQKLELGGTHLSGGGGAGQLIRALPWLYVYP